MKSRSFLWGLAASLAMGILTLDSKTAITGAKEGIDLCIHSLIPSLFPFFVLTSLLRDAFLGTPLPLFRPFGQLLGIPEGCESLLIPGFLGGYPVGAQCIAGAYEEGSLSRNCARRLLLFCSNSGPAFLFGVLGPVFPEVSMVWMLWGIQITGAILCAWFLPADKEPGHIMISKEPSLTLALASAIRIMGVVCGWVILFRVAIAFCQQWFLWLLPPVFRVAVMGVLELSNGCCALVSVEDIRLRFVLCAGMLSFGGLCVTMQTASAIGSLPLFPYVISKLLQSLFCLILAAGLMYRALWICPLLAVVCLILKKTVDFSGLLMYNEPINLRRNPYAVSEENRARLYVLPARRAAGGRTDPLHQKRTAQSR